MNRAVLTSTAVLLTVCVTSACGRSNATMASAAPVDPCTAALAAGPERNELDRAISKLQQDARQPAARSRNALERLGYMYVARARVANDPGDYTLAEAAARCLDASSPGTPAALLLRGHVLHQLHRFGEAEQIARRLVATRSFVLDYGLLGDALMEQGRLSEAVVAYQKMMDLKPFHQSYTRAAHVRWLKGDLKGATEMMRLAIGAASPHDPESSAWAWTRLAGYELQAGRFSEATRAVEAALRYQPGYAAALLAKGRILLATNDLANAVTTLRQAAGLNPLPEYQWLLADALRAQGLASEAREVETALESRGRVTDPRTLALYLATRRKDVPAAISLAGDELRTRADVFTLDARAWTLAAGGRIADALPVISRAVAEGTEDGRLFLHAGVIQAAAGRHGEARRWLEKARRLRHTLLPSEIDELTTQLTATHTNQEN